MGRLGDTQIVVGVILGCTVNDSKEIDIAAGVVDVRGWGQTFLDLVTSLAERNLVVMWL